MIPRVVLKCEEDELVAEVAQLGTVLVEVGLETHH